MCDIYETRLQLYKEILLRENNFTSKYTFLTRASCLLLVDNDVLQHYCASVNSRDGKADFNMISLIPLLYFENIEQGKKDDVVNALKNYPFWPNKEHTVAEFTNTVFWSENHILMLLSSSFLFKQYAKRHCVLTRIQDVEEILLLNYLKAHVKFNGVYEVLSHCYLPYTLCALLNLFDYSEVIVIKELAQSLINVIITQILWGTDANGIATLTASARSFPRFYFRRHNHNINQLIFLLIGVSPDSPAPMALSDFLLTTTWRPDKLLIQQAHQFTGFISARLMNHNLPDIGEIYSEVPPEDVTPIYWSAGLVVHPEYASLTRDFQRRHYLSNNTHLWPLSYLSNYLTTSLMTSFSHWSTGQNYTGIYLNLYKKQDILLSSFQRYHGSIAGFEQYPWCANLAGVGIWSQSQAGSGTQKLFKFGISNIHLPHIIQRDGVLVAAYVTPSAVHQLNALLSTYVTLCWPSLWLTSEIRQSPSSSSSPSSPPEWWVGRRASGMIGVFCTSTTVSDVSVRDEYSMERRICKAEYHSWIIVVATAEEFDSLPVFLDYCNSLVVEETLPQRDSYLQSASLLVASGLQALGKRPRSVSRHNSTTSQTVDAKQYRISVRDPKVAQPLEMSIDVI